MHEFIMDRKEQKQLKAELIFAKRLENRENLLAKIAYIY